MPPLEAQSETVAACVGNMLIAARDAGAMLGRVVDLPGAEAVHAKTNELLSGAATFLHHAFMMALNGHDDLALQVMEACGR